MSITNQTALQLAAQLRSGALRVSEVLDACYAQIEAAEPTVHGYISLCREDAYAFAAKVQARLDAGEARSALAGVPIAIKDLICTKGIPTTCASKMLEGFRPPYNATVIERLHAADLIPLGKTNMDEFAMGSTTETSAFGVTRNPHNPAHVPGGSSGGSAAVLAAGEAPIALGSDTGGSIRQPCAYCGVTGLKPTYGAVSRYGLIAYASSLDQIGPMGRCAADCAALFEIIAGRDEKDSSSMDFPAFSAAAALAGDLRGKRIGVPAEFLGEGLQPAVAKALREAAERFRALGATVEEFPLPMLAYAVPTYYIIACAEACSNLSRYDGIKYGHSAAGARDLLETYILSRSEGFGMEVKRRIMLGNFVLSSGYYDAYYKKALQAKRMLQQAYFKAFETYDMLLGPVAPTTAPKLGESLSDPLRMYLSDIYTVTVNLAGLPALALPCGTDENALPIGMQLIGKPFGESALFAAADAYQRTEDAPLGRL
ncbi:MAG: Asp-tRNA(Asn)/Glu-tRNA(Gln) amidotransferase subunit GatA [Oscillospiraceae bacterium]|jgi:aspartyl-tRNA(Asn)/glutamyl-tRNA(Gln) amidotransferase subunit A|nr:Asp-tRNA(Asn)/Glu-tRNA(Gln) amidotransferase subunit GatA [Oscillospiraceae bacterium]